MRTDRGGYQGRVHAKRVCVSFFHICYNIYFGGNFIQHNTINDLHTNVDLLVLLRKVQEFTQPCLLNRTVHGWSFILRFHLVAVRGTSYRSTLFLFMLCNSLHFMSTGKPVKRYFFPSQRNDTCTPKSQHFFKNACLLSTNIERTHRPLLSC